MTFFKAKRISYNAYHFLSKLAQCASNFLANFWHAAYPLLNEQPLKTICKVSQTDLTVCYLVYCSW
jgi:hypothetical protein